MNGQPSHITLSQLGAIIKDALWRSLSSSYWVSCEISEIKVNYSGHCYLELTEKATKGHMAKAKSSAVIWKSSYKLISDHFFKQTGSQLASGMKIMVNVSVSFHELYGMSLVINDIDPAYTLGDIEQTRRQTIQRLKSEGIYELNKELPLGEVLQNVAVISSQGAAGFQDFIKEIAKYRERYNISITLYNAVMQGHDTEPTVTDALERIVGSGIDYDAIVIIRGGGSQTDLSAFDSYRICSYISQCPLPIITGIGHDKDISVSDLVAHTSVKTPTAAARFIIDSLERIDKLLEQFSLRVKELSHRFFTQEQGRIEQLSVAIERSVRATLHRQELLLRSAQEQLGAKSLGYINMQQMRLSAVEERLVWQSGNYLKNCTSHLQRLEAAAEALSPKRIFSLGYSIARGQAGVIRSGKDAKVGEMISIELSDAKIEAKIETIS